MPDFSVFEKTIETWFKSRRLLEQAFVHRSYLNENKHIKLEHNERLEFLGDAVLELIATDYLYHKYPDKTEGDLTSFRSALVNANTLSEIAAKLGMENYLLLSRGESKDKGKARQYILANTMEALIGAIYLDSGYDAAKFFVEKHVTVLIDDIVARKAWSDAKSSFQEQAQERVGITPAYKVLREVGPDHDKQFTVGVYLKTTKVAEGTGRSKQEAEQVAAEHALKEKGW